MSSHTSNVVECIGKIVFRITSNGYFIISADEYLYVYTEGALANYSLDTLPTLQRQCGLDKYFDIIEKQPISLLKNHIFKIEIFKNKYIDNNSYVVKIHDIPRGEHFITTVDYSPLYKLSMVDITNICDDKI